jgi:hypothetical protein
MHPPKSRLQVSRATGGIEQRRSPILQRQWTARHIAAGPFWNHKSKHPGLLSKLRLLATGSEIKL